MAASQFPTEINYNRAVGIVRISWNDGHVGEYAAEYLRGHCPCALCQGHGTERQFVSVPNAQIQEIQPVGNYAVEFRWHDGHSTGIYSYDYLRALCPCAACNKRSSDRS
ncbi:MAG: gamma-butyrobetaine hydroxylase-like domain-containing protein [Alphaproteobacteria bacterium]